MSFQILMNGVGNAFSRQHYGTNFLLQKDGFLLAVDCPDSYRNALQDHAFEHGGEEVDVDKIDAIVITHLHGDHVNGLEMALAYRRYVSGGKWKIYTSPESGERLWEGRLQVSLGRSYNGESYDDLTPDDYYDLEIIEWGEPTKIGPFEITCAAPRTTFRRWRCASPTVSTRLAIRATPPTTRSLSTGSAMPIW